VSLFDALILGLIQGFTEFLPVSSSGHLALFEHWLNLDQDLLGFNVAVHIGTLFSVLFFFKREVLLLFTDSFKACGLLLRGEKWAAIVHTAPYAKWALSVLIATIPAVLAGFFLRDWFAGLFDSLFTIGLAFFATSLFLGVAHLFQSGTNKIEEGTWLQYVAIGILQAAAIIPGISRSGATVSAGLVLGFEREAAFRFAFLMSLPAILGAAVLEIAKAGNLGDERITVLLAAVIVAAFSGFAALRIFALVLRNKNLLIFSGYTLILGIVTLFLS